MDNLLDLDSHEETQLEEAATATDSETLETAVTTQPLVEVEDETSTAPQSIKGIGTAPKVQVKKPLPRKAVTKPNHTHEEPPPNPLLLDPYEWNKCTITVGYSLLPSQKVNVSVHNHKDEPIVKEFPAQEVPLPEKISKVMAALQSIWPISPVNATVVLLPKPENAPERPIIASVRVSTDTPIMQEGVESDLPFPAPIVAMLEELKALMPERALKKIETKAKTQTATTIKPAGKSTASKAAVTINAPTVNKNIHQDQLTLF